MPNPDSRGRRGLLLKVAVAAALLVVVAVLVMRGVDLKGWIERGLGVLRSGGPWVFFTAMALLPAVGAPLSAFTVSAGTVFAGQMGMGAVVAAALLAVTINLALTYWLAAKALRPLLTRLVARLGYKMPEVAAADATDLIVVVRVTPGPPFIVQSYLLGLARVPFGKYMLISILTVWSYSIALILFGDALLHGKGRMVVIGVLALVALTAFTHLLRRHYGKKQKAS